ncbi:Phosphatidylinositol N-acetylglucosaminyltransferase subunit gpi15 [Cytospora mali]|uniref:Phosphatidylinositol N-acetylglucosaminyltransferase subunit gpi15 n=1 Tax=Cytospora mali TaxID=578113 RepID=A0A194V410_CYTMA|nr:Phosphatidylinositol N-acetylglucosaminyltransferase subunit gpi15 [Valsa mali var. pyri (nom. inval.)]
MLTTAPHLHVRRPSPTTAEFTVSTCPPTTLSLRILLAIFFLLRVLLGLSVLLLLYSVWTLSPYGTTHATAVETDTPTATSSVVMLPNEHDRTHESSTIVGDGDGLTDGDGNYNDDYQTLSSARYMIECAGYILRAVYLSPIGQTSQRLAASLPTYLLLPLCAALLYLTTLRIHTTESLLVLRGLGIQTSSTGGSYLASWRAGTRFIPTEKIRDVLINEAFRGFAVRYYLVVVVDGEEDVVVVFPRLLPRRRIVETVWRGVRGCLWEPDGSVPVSKRLDEKGTCG